MKKILFLCNTPYQILFVTNYLYNMDNYTADIIITDEIANYILCKDRIENTKLFEKVYVLEQKKVKRTNKVGELFRYYLQLYLDKNCIDGYIKLKSKYDEFFFANFNCIPIYIRRRIMKNNKNLKIFMFEDGFATYSDFYGNTLYDILHPKTKIRRLLRKRIYDLYYSIEGIAIFNQHYLQWKLLFKIISVPLINPKNKEFLNILRTEFVGEAIDEYSQKYIFFEESYYADGKDVHDIEVVSKIANIVGKDNIIVKIHPRNKDNRFEKLGFITNKNLSVPWEVLSMLIPLEDKVLITIASVSVLTPQILFGLKYKGYMLYECIEDKTLLRGDILPTYKYMCERTKKMVQIPQNLNEALQIIKNENDL